MSVIKHLGIKKGATTWAVPIYSTTGEAGSAYSYIKVGDTTGYIPLCSTSDSRATAGRVKEHTGTIWAIATSGIPEYKKVTYNTPGSYTFTVPEGVTKLRVEVAGAGGSGGTNGYSSSGDGWQHGGKGGNGAKVNSTLNVTPSSVISVIVGAGGRAPGGYNRNGNAGGASSVGSISAGGGAGGRRGEEGTPGANAGNGAGGAGSDSSHADKNGVAGANGWVIIEYGQGVQ